ncbi:MAG: PSD1 and planctomycete cytochrome C domain-containing protein [Opitutales bacterium]
MRFNTDVLPILSENCFECHGPDKAARKADLRLDRKGGDKDWSALVKRITSRDPKEVMPKPKTGKKLKPEQIEMLRKWVESGSKYEQHWSFQPIRVQEPPLTKETGLTAIDRFIALRLNEAGLQLSEPISRAKLIRRATFDLTGLPPTWSEVEAFEKDRSTNAFAKVVDRLLESAAYGERWGRHWLDLARYADTHGGSAIGFKRFPFSYTYRDYVIKAFNADLPYDRFIREQLAADQLKLPEDDPALAALGFLTVGQQFRNRHDRLDDRIDVITRGMLGLTVTCARCHDHKFDPIPTADYYSLHATLASSSVPNELPLVGKPKISEKYVNELAVLEKTRDDVIREQGEVFRGRLRMQVGIYLRELAKGVPEQDTSTTFLSYRTEDIRPVVLERWRKYLQARTENDPVFGPWHRLSRLDTEGFRDSCRELVLELKKQNGDPKKFSAEQNFGTKSPKWNPRVLDALETGEPNSFVEVAEVYGKVFTDGQRRWLRSLLQASEEASPEGKVVPDQDARHKVVNSAIERQLRHHLHAPESPTSITFKDRRKFGILNRGVRDATSGMMVTAIENANLGGNAPPRSMVLRESPEGEKDFVLLRGNPIARGEPVEPHFLSALSGKNPRRFVDGERRLGLAEEMTNPDNPLTRRVIVNWVWQHHFGRGLVRTPDDFGTRGDPPTHPKLLDYLAVKLLEDRWSLKKLHRRIMLTAVYHQGSLEKPSAREIDPENALLWRMPTRMLQMEAMRDSMLAASGELDRKLGGRPFEEKEDRAIPRRTVYAFVNRDVISKLSSTFNGADPAACTVKRPETIVPQQTLFALNSTFIQNRATALLKLPDIGQAASEEDRVRLIYQRIFSRAPDAGEVKEALAFLNHGKESEKTRRQFVHALLASNEFHFVD